MGKTRNRSMRIIVRGHAVVKIPWWEHHTWEIKMSHSSEAAKAGIGFGTAMAITISWSANHSIGWAIIHGFLSWLYVIYYAVILH